MITPEVKKQNDSYNCGVYCCKFIELLHKTYGRLNFWFENMEEKNYESITDVLYFNNPHNIDELRRSIKLTLENLIFAEEDKIGKVKMEKNERNKKKNKPVEVTIELANNPIQNVRSTRKRGGHDSDFPLRGTLGYERLMRKAKRKQVYYG